MRSPDDWVLASHLEHVLEGFLVGLATATAAAIVAGVVALIRFLRRTDKHRMAEVDRVIAESRRTTHRVGHLIRWARQVGHHDGIPFPLDDDDDLSHDEGLR